MKKYFILLLSFTFFNNLFASDNHNKGSFLVELSGNMGYLYSINEINDKILTEGAGIVDFIPEATALKWNYEFGFAFGYSFNQKFRVSLYANYIMLSKSIAKESDTAMHLYTGSSSTWAKYFEFKTGITAIGVGPVFTYYFADTKHFAFSASTGFMYYPIINFFQDTTYANNATETTTLSANLDSLDSTGATWGALVKLSVDYYFNRYFALGLNLGYNYIKAPTLKDTNSNTINFKYLDGTEPDGGATPLSVNFSNIYAGLALKIEFGGKKSSSRDTSYEIAKTQETQATEESLAPVEEVQTETSSYDDNYNSDQQLDISEIKRLKHRVSRLYRRAKRKKYRKQKRVLGKLHKYIKRVQRKWYKLSYEEQQYYIKKINRKIRRAKRIKR